MSGIRVNEWLHNSGTGGIWQTSAGNVGIASSVPTTKLEVTGDAKISGVTTATAFIPSQGQLSNRNLIINGAMQVAQRGTSSTASDVLLDRWYCTFSGTDESPTHAQHALTSSDTGPWAKGFRNSLHITNGNQTSVGNDYIHLMYRFEAQEIANCGWDYTNTSSYITVSFWVKSSVSQNFYGDLVSKDGTARNYVFDTGTLSANTWTKITKTIPGNSGLQFDNDVNSGLDLRLFQFLGTYRTGSGSTTNAWQTYSSSERTPDQTSTWYTTNDATWEITGVQLEVGSVATPFEHRSYGDELLRCKRYFNMMADGSLGTARMISDGFWWSNNEVDFMYTFPVEMRTTPSVYQVMSTAYVQVQGGGVSPTLDGNWTLQYATKMGTSHYTGKTGGGTAGNSLHLTVNNSAMRLGYNAEL